MFAEFAFLRSNQKYTNPILNLTQFYRTSHVANPKLISYNSIKSGPLLAYENRYFCILRASNCIAFGFSIIPCNSLFFSHYHILRLSTVYTNTHVYKPFLMPYLFSFNLFSFCISGWRTTYKHSISNTL